MADVLEIQETSEATTDEPHVLHGVHLTCQRDHDYYLAVCGEMVFPHEMNLNSTDAQCEGCWSFPATCPVCGTPLEHA